MTTKNIKLPISNSKVNQKLELGMDDTKKIIAWYFENFHNKKVENISMLCYNNSLSTTTVHCKDNSPDVNIVQQTNQNKGMELSQSLDIIIED